MPILLALLVGLLLAFQYFTLTKLAVEPAGAGLVSLAAFARNLTAQIEFSRLDIALGFALLTVVELLVAAEIWFRALTRLPRSRPRHRTRCLSPLRHYLPDSGPILLRSRPAYLGR